mgnify:FL=1
MFGWKKKNPQETMQKIKSGKSARVGKIAAVVFVLLILIGNSYYSIK